MVEYTIHFTTDRYVSESDLHDAVAEKLMAEGIGETYIEVNAD